MGFFDWILKGVGVEPEEDNATSSVPREKKIKEKKQKIKKNKGDTMRGNYDNFGDTRNNFAENRDQFNTNNYFYTSNDKPMQAQASVGGYGTKNVVIYYPKNYEEVQTLIDYLKQGESAIMNLDGISDAEAQRILDFVSGSVYALSGSIHRITGNIFILTPEGLNIMVPKS